MTEITNYICDTCGRAFDDPDDCEAHERQHLFSEFKNKIHAYDRHRNHLDILSCTPDEVDYIFCDTEEAAKAYHNWCREGGCSSPYFNVFVSPYREFQPGVWFYDANNLWGTRGEWVYLQDKLDELTEILEYFQQ